MMTHEERGPRLKAKPKPQKKLRGYGDLHLGRPPRTFVAEDGLCNAVKMTNGDGLGGEEEDDCDWEAASEEWDRLLAQSETAQFEWIAERDRRQAELERTRKRVSVIGVILSAVAVFFALGASPLFNQAGPSPLEVRVEEATTALTDASEVVGTLGAEIEEQNAELERLIEERTQNEALASLSGQQAEAILSELEEQNQGNLRSSIWVTIGGVVASGLFGWFLNELTRAWRLRRAENLIEQQKSVPERE